MFTCTPGATGTFSLVLTINDTPAVGKTYRNWTQVQLYLVVYAITVTSFSAAPNPAKLGQMVTFSTTVAGANGAVTYSYLGLPAGCASANTATLTCTPTAAGTSTVTVTASDPTPASSSKSTSLTVTPVSITSFSASPSAIYDNGWTNFTVVVTGVTGAVTYSYTGLPAYSPGCLSQNLAVLPCHARVAGTFSVTVTATDTAGDTSMRSTTLTVYTLTVTSFTISPSPTFQGQRTSIHTIALGYFGAPTYVYTNLSLTGCTSQNASTFTCVPSVRGQFNVSVTVSDWTGNHTTSSVINLIVNPVAQPGFYVGLNTSFSDQPVFKNKVAGTYNQLCYTTNNSPFYSSTCYMQAADPSVVTLPGGITGVAYSRLTVNTSSACQGTNSLIAFSLSTTNGSTFAAAPTMIGNFTSCAYLDAIEPSFGFGAGTIFGVFIEENSTQGVLPVNYAPRPGDALAFVKSISFTSTGVVWAPVKTIDPAGGLALPQIAVVGQTIYVVYEQIANSTTPIPGGNLPIAVRYIYSTNGGSTWSSPTTLPGLNASQGFNAMSPSITVSSQGTVAVAYATDRTCIAFGVAKSCARYGSSVVALTSTTNGTTWSGPYTVTKGVGETTCYLGQCLQFFFQSTPQTAIAYSPNGTRLFVAWAGTANLSAGILPSKSNLWYRWTVVGVAQSASGGTKWTGGIVPGAAVDPKLGGGNRTNYFRPAIGVYGSTLYLTYSVDNETPSTFPFPGPFDNSYSQWVVNASVQASSLALPWVRATPTAYVPVPAGRLTNFTRNSFSGYHSAVGFNAGGTPLVGFSIVELPVTSIVSRTGYYSVNATYATNLTIAAPARYGLSQVVNVTFSESGLPPQSTWQFILNNQIVTAANTSSLLLTNVPKGVPVFPKILPYLTGWGVKASQSISVGSIAVFTVPSTVSLVYSVQVGYQQFFGPTLSFPSSCGSFCYFEFVTQYYTYQCLPGGACDPTSLGYCDYYQLGCYYLEMYAYEELYGYGTSHYYYNGTYVWAFYYTDVSGTHFTSCYYTCYPIYLPIGFKLAGNAQSYSYNWGVSLSPYATYANGSGRGSYTGPAQGQAAGAGIWGNCAAFVYGACEALYYNYWFYAPTCYSYSWVQPYCNYAPVVMNAPINETVWLLPSSSGAGLTYPEEVVPKGLPAGSQYSFQFDGVPHTALSPNPVILSAVLVGSHAITHAQAKSPTPGWYYFGSDTSVSVPTQPIVTLTFGTYENISASARTVTFHALNVTTGSIWRLQFNGTTYSSSTPYLNLSARPGNYSIAAYSLVSATGDAAFVPKVPSMVSLITRTLVNLSFIPSYRVAVQSTVGGTVSLGTTQGVPSTSAFFAVGATVRINASSNAGYAFLGWTGTGAGSYTGPTAATTLTVSAPVEEAANFYALAQARYSLSFAAVGLPAGTWWTVYLNGVGYSTSASVLVVPNVYACGGSCSSPAALGHYALVIGTSYLNSTTNHTRFIGTGPSWVSTNGTTASVQIAFTPQYLIDVEATPGGTVTVQNGNLVIATEPFWATVASTVQIQATPFAPTAQGRFVFLGWNGTGTGSYTGVLAQQTVIAQAPITEIASFQFVPNPPPTQYTLELILTTPVAKGTSWSAQIGSAQYSSTGTTLNATGLLKGPYTVTLKTAYSPDGLTRYVPQASVQVTITGDGTKAVGYNTQYWVQVGNTTGGSIAVSGASGGAAPTSGWYSSGSKISIGANPLPNYVFTFWNGTGNGSYSGPLMSANLTVTGPISEVANFIPPAPRTVTVGGFFSTLPSWIVLAIVGYAAGLGVGLMVFRARGRRPPTARPPPRPEEAEPAQAEPEPITEEAEPPAAEEAVPEYIEDQGGDQ